MSKTLRTIGIIAGVVAISLAIPGVGPAIGLSAAAAADAAAIASAVASVATAGSVALQKPPDAQGTINEVMIGANMPVPYAMGRTFVGGFKVYDDSGGFDNVDRTQIFVGSHAGPIEGFEKFLADYSPITFAVESGGLISGVATGYYGADDGYLWLNSRLGARPDTALTQYAGRAAFRNWGASSKLSGMAAWSVTMEFDEEAKRWASGIPAFGIVAQWVWAYDPRLDSTYPGGSGAQRWDDEASWAWTENPALHALTYARGRFMGAADVKVIGCGIAKESIDLPAFVEFANVCTANGWAVGGCVYEGPGISKWDNLKKICDAGAARPHWVGGLLTLTISAPKVALDTVTAEDLAEGEMTIPAMSAWKDKFNTIVPRTRSEAHRWEYKDGAAVSNATYVAEDGEPKSDTRQYDLIQDFDQGAQRAAYDLANEREFGPMSLPLKPRMRLYRPGEALDLDLASMLGDPALGIQLAVITARTVEPTSGSVILELVSETSAKHPFALGQTGTAPPSPSIVTPEEADTAAAAQNVTLAEKQNILRNMYLIGTVDAIDAGSNATIRIYGTTTAANFTLDYSGSVADVSVAPTNLTAKAYSTLYYLFVDVDPATLQPTGFGATTVYGDSINSATHPYRAGLNRKVTTPAALGVPTGGTGTGGGGYGGGGTGPGGEPV